MYRRGGKCDRGSAGKEMSGIADLRLQVCDRESLTVHLIIATLVRVLRHLPAFLRVVRAQGATGASACPAAEAR